MDGISKKDWKRSRVRDGFGAQPFLDPERARMIYWRKVDGMIHPVRLPYDEYHISRYKAKGWSPVDKDVALAEIEEQLAARREEKVQQRGHSLLDIHQHRFGKKLGSRCRTEFCEAERTTPYQKRSKRK